MSTSSYFVEARWGGSEEAPSESRLAELIAELAVPDEEHPDTWLVHRESGWTLRLDEGGYAYLSDEDQDTVSHMKGVSAAQALDLWLRFARGGPAAVEKEGWTAGERAYAEEELDALRERARQITLDSDREFFATLGPEDPSRACRREGCQRGTIKYSALCALHHFEQIRGKPHPLA